MVPLFFVGNTWRNHWGCYQWNFWCVQIYPYALCEVSYNLYRSPYFELMKRYILTCLIVQKARFWWSWLFNQLCLRIHAHFSADMGHPVYIQCIQNGGRLCESIQCFTILSFSTNIHTWPKSGHAIQCWKLLFNHCHFIAWSGCWWFLHPVFHVGLGIVGDCSGWD